MASISKDPNGRRRIQFIGRDKKRYTIRLGKISNEAAMAIKLRVERLVQASIYRHLIDNETAKWVQDLEPALADKLSAVGLIPKKEVAELAAFIKAFIAGREKSVKPGTLITYHNGERNLVEYFGAKKPLREITEGDAEDWVRWLA